MENVPLKSEDSKEENLRGARIRRGRRGKGRFPVFNKRSLYRGLHFFKVLGPGFVVMIADMDAGSVTTAKKKRLESGLKHYGEKARITAEMIDARHTAMGNQLRSRQIKIILD